jgi:hypothetical protein
LHYKQQIPVDNLWFEIWLCLYIAKKSLFMCLLPKDCESAKSWPCVAHCILFRLISIRNWNYLHTLDDNFLFGFCNNRTLNHKFPTECGRWQNMCTEHGLTRSGLEPTIYRTRGEHANDYTTDESLWWAFLVCFSANTYIIQGRIQDFKLGDKKLSSRVCK